METSTLRGTKARKHFVEQINPPLVAQVVQLRDGNSPHVPVSDIKQQILHSSTVNRGVVSSNLVGELPELKA